MLLVLPDVWGILTIVGEALSEPFEGKLAVGEVIRERMRRRYASDGTVVGTVFRAKQFSMWDDRARILAARADDTHPSVQECIKAWHESEHTDIVPGAVLYHTKTIARIPPWAISDQTKHLKDVGAHRFYLDRSGMGN